MITADECSYGFDTDVGGQDEERGCDQLRRVNAEQCELPLNARCPRGQPRRLDARVRAIDADKDAVEDVCHPCGVYA